MNFSLWSIVHIFAVNVPFCAEPRRNWSRIYNSLQLGLLCHHVSHSSPLSSTLHPSFFSSPHFRKRIKTSGKYIYVCFQASLYIFQNRMHTFSYDSLQCLIPSSLSHFLVTSMLYPLSFS